METEKEKENPNLVRFFLRRKKREEERGRRREEERNTDKESRTSLFHFLSVEE